MNRMFNLDSPLWNILSKFCDLPDSQHTLDALLPAGRHCRPRHRSALSQRPQIHPGGQRLRRIHLLEVLPDESETGHSSDADLSFPVAFVIVSYLFADSLGNDNLLERLYTNVYPLPSASLRSARFLCVPGTLALLYEDERYLEDFHRICRDAHFLYTDSGCTDRDLRHQSVPCPSPDFCCPP